MNRMLLGVAMPSMLPSGWSLSKIGTARLRRSGVDEVLSLDRIRSDQEIDEAAWLRHCRDAGQRGDLQGVSVRDVVVSVLVLRPSA